MSPVTKVVVGSTFGINPPRGGGQLRIFHLYRWLATRCPVDVVALVEGEEGPARRELAPGLTEIRVRKSGAHVAAEAELRHATGMAVTDIAFVELHELTPAFTAAVAASMTSNCVLVASHPYAFPAMARAGGHARWWYDAHNVEADLKATMLPRSRLGRRLLAQTREVERACCRRAELVLATCADDSDRLRKLYRVPRSHVRIVANGIDASSIPFTRPTQRRDLCRRLRMTQPLALFIGSWHEPNVLAARRILELAHKLPDVRFAIVGSVGIPLADAQRPPNVELFGVIADELKNAILGVAAVALNPMSRGSGTNMKMLDYMAAGIPVVSTEVGARGLGLDLGRDLHVAALEDFGAAVQAALDETGEVADARARATRDKIESRFDWESVAAPLFTALDENGETSQSPDRRWAINA